ncbi:SlyX family protein [Corticibacter populi]|uniref:SlyX family protein n=1 Tax=Corticibacter populi TaxID=1550736 RepID=A0A3M6QYA0_9BURK|nr:SlyX family protein [Corticibacter populi]RMX07984.1 SlyX family protein [Corticibacter populi]RZS35226.1 SlyX protein [Corticibacter populi]
MSDAQRPQSTDAFQQQAETRLTDIEIKLSYSEDLLEQLNLLVYRQQAQIEALSAHVQRLQQMQASPGNEAPRDPRDELPPHY